MKKYNRRRRREAIGRIVSMFAEEFDMVRYKTRRTVNAPWRHAVEMWLLREKIITVSQPKSVTHSSVKSVS
jgi:hypothetical protein